MSKGDKDETFEPNYQGRKSRERDFRPSFQPRMSRRRLDSAASLKGGTIIGVSEKTFLVLSFLSDDHRHVSIRHDSCHVRSPLTSWCCGAGK